MYSKGRAPEYLQDDHPGASKVPCKSLIKKVKEDKSSVGLTGDQCMEEAQIYFNEKCKKTEATERARNARKMKKLQK